MAEAKSLVLASASTARRSMLQAAGLTFAVEPANVDEAAIRVAMGQVPAEAVAARLASEKALQISRTQCAAYVIGSDQVLAIDGMVLSKADTLAQARDQLMMLRGCAHRLISAVALAREGEVVWRHSAVANLMMRQFSEQFVDAYLADVGDRVLGSVGCYELEGRGVQLFDRIDGDYFTILGMPLLSLLARLREEGVLLS